MSKGILSEILSKAMFHDITYRNFEKAVEINLSEFLIESNNFTKIPVHRIILIKHKNKIIYKTTKPNLIKLL